MISFKFMLPQINPKSEVTFWPGVIGICILFYSAQISIRYISWLSTIVGSQSHSWSFPMHTLVVREKMDRICPCCWTWPPPRTCPMFRLLCRAPPCPPPGTLPGLTLGHLHKWATSVFASRSDFRFNSGGVFLSPVQGPAICALVIIKSI